MRIIGLVGSPRRGRNTDTLVTEALRGAESEGAQVEKVLLAELTYEGCRACAACGKDGHCVVRDDAHEVLMQIRDARGVVFGTPLYYANVPGQMKLFLDRCNCFLEMVPREGKRPLFRSRMPGPTRKGLLIAVSGSMDRDRFQGVRDTIRFAAHDLNIEMTDELLVPFADDLDVPHNDDLKAQAFEKGRALARAVA